MDVDHIEPTIYHTWIYYFYRGLFRDMLEGDKSLMSLISNYPFRDFMLLMFEDITKNSEASRYNRACQAGFNYEGKKACGYNVVMSLARAHDFLFENMGPNPSAWKWGVFHTNEYPNMPWSRTPLKFLFHRSVPVGGSQNTPNVAKFKWEQFETSKRFLSDFVAGYKMVMDHSADQSGKAKGRFSQDTGQSGNLLSMDGHYFDMNKRHLSGDLFDMVFDVDSIQDPYVLELVPAAQAKNGNKKDEM
jgi:acyl-homoserine lactone acylase PvdQ